jgi:hypothetical protein
MWCSLDLQLACKSHPAWIYSIDRACFSLAFHEHFSPLFCSLDFLLHFFIKKKVEQKIRGLKARKLLKSNHNKGYNKRINILPDSSDSPLTIHHAGSEKNL